MDIIDSFCFWRINSSAHLERILPYDLLLMFLGRDAGKLSYSRRRPLRWNKLWSASCSANIPFVRKSNSVCGIFSVLWKTFSCRRGVSRFALIYESTSLPCVTDLSMSRGLALGGLSGLPGVSDGTSLSLLGGGVCMCVLQQRWESNTAYIRYSIHCSEQL